MAKIHCHRDEKSSAALWISPGLVRDKEVVLRTIFDPHHIEDGKLSNAAIALQDLALRGWSVDRRRYTSFWRLRFGHWVWQWQYKKKDRPLSQCFVVPVSVSGLRSLGIGGQQTFSVTDMAQVFNPAHAAIVTAVPVGARSSAVRKARDLLLQNLPQYVEVHEAFGGEDRWGWSRGILMACCAVIKFPFKRLRSFF